MLFISLFKRNTRFFIYFLISLVICSGIPLSESEITRAKQNSTSLPEDKRTGNVSSHQNNKVAKVMDALNISKTNLAHDKNDSQVPVSVNAVPENKTLLTAAMQDGNLRNSSGASTSSQMKPPVVKSSSPPTVVADQISVTRSNVVKNKETESVMKKEKDKEQPPLPPEKQGDSVSKQPPLKADEEDDSVKDDDDNSGEIKDFFEEGEKSFEITEQDEDETKKEMDGKKNSEPNLTDEKGEKDQSSNSNGNPVPEKSTSSPRTVFPNKNGMLYDDTNSHFFAYFLTLMVMAVLFYLLFHNKQRIIALVVEGRRGRPSRRASSRAKYHKLDNNLEEAMSSTRGGGVEEVSAPLGKIY